VPFCLVIKHKLKQQQLQLRLQQAQLLRRRMAVMNTQSTVPSGALPGNSSTGGTGGVLAGVTVGQGGVMSGQPCAGNTVSVHTPPSACWQQAWCTDTTCQFTASC
jgi:E1A/CREB-binding protein